MLEYKDYVLVSGVGDHLKYVCVTPHAILTRPGDLLELTGKDGKKVFPFVLSPKIALFQDNVDFLKKQGMILDDAYTVTARLSRIDDLEER